jgi:uncharacterized membrane protein
MGKYFFFNFVIYKTFCIFFRFVLFAVYNLTTRALFSSGYPLSILFQDLAWGTLYNTVYTGVYMIIWSKLTNPVDI